MRLATTIRPAFEKDLSLAADVACMPTHTTASTPGLHSRAHHMDGSGFCPSSPQHHNKDNTLPVHHKYARVHCSQDDKHGTVETKQCTIAAYKLVTTLQVLLCSSCTSPGLRANAVPTSRYVEIGLCELATSRRLSSPIGPLLGSISASNTPPPLPQQRPTSALGMASFSAYASLLSTRVIGASLHLALLSMQQVPVRLP